MKFGAGVTGASVSGSVKANIKSLQIKLGGELGLSAGFSFDVDIGKESGKIEINGGAFVIRSMGISWGDKK